MTLASLLSLETVYVLTGLMLFVFAAFTAFDRGNSARFGTAIFWFLLGATFVFGSVMPYWLSGTIVVAMVFVDLVGRVRKGDYRENSADERKAAAARYGYRLFVPVLMIPTLTYGATLVVRGPAIDQNLVLYFALSVSSLLAGVAALALTRARVKTFVDEGRRLADAIGSAVILPQLLAALGVLFTAAGVGKALAAAVGFVLPVGNLLAVVVACCVSLALCTLLMGNSFAAFPVVMAGIGIPLLVVPFRASPEMVAAVCMTAASCGTLCTPMAANFNIVPPALFEMRDRYGVIRFQAPYAAALFLTHILLLWALVASGA